VSNTKENLDAAANSLVLALCNLDIAYEHISKAYDDDEPGYPYPDSQDARAWDYIDAIWEAQRAIGHRLNTWDEGDYYE
jgi:hypothetical protein